MGAWNANSCQLRIDLYDAVQKQIYPPHVLHKLTWRNSDSTGGVRAASAIGTLARAKRYFHICPLDRSKTVTLSLSVNSNAPRHGLQRDGTRLTDLPRICEARLLCSVAKMNNA
jgi:hypothetical protein